MLNTLNSLGNEEQTPNTWSSREVSLDLGFTQVVLEVWPLKKTTSTPYHRMFSIQHRISTMPSSSNSNKLDLILVNIELIIIAQEYIIFHFIWVF